MRNQLSRRTVLRGAGVSVALPLLEAMAPVSVQAATGYRRKKEPLRMAFVYAPNGIHMSDWTPQEEGSDYRLPPTLEPLRELQVTLVFSVDLPNIMPMQMVTEVVIMPEPWQPS
jgi:hypothetical protein